MPANNFSSEIEMLELIENTLYTAVISDILDSIGLKNRTMYPNIRPIPGKQVVAGRVRTLLWQNVYEVYENPYKIEIEAMDALKQGDVPVHATGNSDRIVPWGALMTNAAIARGARGVVLDGCVRDVKAVISLRFPVFAAGIRPLDSKGRGYVTDYDCPVQCGGVSLNTGDLIFADYDGVVVVPNEIVEEVVIKAQEKVRKENISIKELKQGRLLGDVYATYGVL